MNSGGGLSRLASFSVWNLSILKYLKKGTTFLEQYRPSLSEKNCEGNKYSSECDRLKPEVEK
jgi:hypothetical protein